MAQVRGQGFPVVLVDAGDAFFSNPTKKAPTPAEKQQELRKGRVVLNAYNFLGYQAIGVGPADLQLGIDTLKAFEKEAKFPFLCANLVDQKTRKPIFAPHLVLDVGGIKVGLYSVIMQLTNEAYARRVLAGAEILDPEKTTGEVVAELKKSCDIVIALSQLNVDANEQILDRNPGIDVLVDPYSRSGTKAIWIPENEYLTVRNKTPVLRIDGQGSRVGVFEMYFVAGAKKFAEYRAVDGALEPHILRHPEMTSLVQDFEKGRTTPLAIKFDPAKPRVVEDFLGEEGCGTCHEEQHAFWKGTKHAAAYATLVKTEDQFRPDCVGCHTLGYGVSFVEPEKVGRFKEVQCESCHGSNAAHADNPKANRLGAVAEEACWGCHNPQITQKEFHYDAARERASCPKIQR